MGLLKPYTIGVLLFLFIFVNTSLAFPINDTSKKNRLEQELSQDSLLTISSSYSGDELRVEYTVENVSDDIKNANISLRVTGGVPPYQYKWSDQSIHLHSNYANNLTEGIETKVLVTDSSNDSIYLEILIPAYSSAEKINSWFIPLVSELKRILFWDPFAALGIYDPLVYDENDQPLLHPNGDAHMRTIPIVVIWLIVGAIIFTIKMRFINFIGFKHAIDLTRGVFDKPGEKGEVSHFQALATALSGTVGLGNIAGVAIAIATGGPGATFWMIVAGLFGMTTKFVECTLGVKYRNIDENGVVSGGPMYYLTKGLKKRKLGGLGKVLAIFFAILLLGGSFSGGSMFQSNQAFAQLKVISPFF